MPTSFAIVFIDFLALYTRTFGNLRAHRLPDQNSNFAERDNWLRFDFYIPTRRVFNRLKRAFPGNARRYLTAIDFL